MAQKIIDMHTHCFARPDLKSEFIWYDKNYRQKISEHNKALKKNGIEKALVYIFDQRAAAMPDIKKYNRLNFALAIDFRDRAALSLIRKAKLAGFKGIKILPYEQRITPKDYKAILKIAEEIEKQNMFLTICSTFGGRDLYDYDALALASFLLQKNYRAPIILAHAGGSRIKDAILIADSSPNVYLESSFTVSYWRGSSVIEDLAWGIKKLPNRFFFGSDYPNVAFSQAKEDALEMLNSNKIPKKLQNDFFYDNSLNFLKKYE